MVSSQIATEPMLLPGHVDSKLKPFDIRGTTAGQETDRALWLDALKVCSILGVIGIHVTSDSAGLPYPSFPEYDRMAPTLGRAVASLFNYPIFFVVSFFLLAGAVEQGKRNYGELVGARLRRLVPPFLIWSVIYLLFRNVKAIAFGYQNYYLQELATPMSWVNYLFVGSAQYHLHFLPTLIMLTLLYPSFRVARRWPVFGLGLVAALALWPQLDASIYSSLGHRPQFLPLALSLTKAIGSCGFGFLGFALYGLTERAQPSRAIAFLVAGAVLVGAAAAMIGFEGARETAIAGEWLPRDFRGHLAHYLAPACVTIIFLLLKGRASSLIWTRLSALSFGVYLFHPIVLDLLEIAERGWTLRPAITVAFNFVAVTLLSFLAVLLASRVPILRNLFGVQEDLR